jgi:hypothetical protein
MVVGERLYQRMPEAFDGVGTRNGIRHGRAERSWKGQGAYSSGLHRRAVPAVDGVKLIQQGSTIPPLRFIRGRRRI